MEKRFETDKDLKNEIEIIERFSKYCNTTYKKLGDNEIDFALSRDGKIVAYVEIKNYTVASTKFPTQIIAIKKLSSMQARSSKGIPCMWVMRFSDDVIMYVDVKEVKGMVKHGGRKPREGSLYDQELVLYCDKSVMKTLL